MSIYKGLKLLFLPRNIHKYNRSNNRASTRVNIQFVCLNKHFLRGLLFIINSYTIYITLYALEKYFINSE